MTAAWKAIVEDRVIAVVRAGRVPNPAGVADAFAAGGIRCVEFTCTIPEVTSVIAAAADARYAIVGVGTVIRDDQARSAVEAGAQFVVSPAMRPEIVPAAGGLPVFMGAITPT